MTTGKNKYKNRFPDGRIVQLELRATAADRKIDSLEQRIRHLETRPALSGLFFGDPVELGGAATNTVARCPTPHHGCMCPKFAGNAEIDE